jgi:hypothetical protein
MRDSVLSPQMNAGPQTGRTVPGALLVEAIIALGALVQALLTAYLLITHGLTDVARAWPALFTDAVHLLLWPLAALAHTSPSQVGVGAILVAIALYLALTFAGVGAINLLTRQPPMPPVTRAG